MNNTGFINEYGAYRSIEPAHTFPILAWKLDTSLPIRDDEILIKVRLINVNAASFNQIAGGDNADPIEIAKKISSIVALRGKLHNPITGTGGTMMGEVLEVGINHPEYGKVRKGDRICTLMSTSMSPLVLDRITGINMNTRQIEVEGYAILFRDSYFSKVPDGWNPNVYLAIVGEAGSCYESALRCRPDSTVLLIGASEKVGLLSMFAVREKLGNTGKLIAVTRHAEQYEELKSLNVADMIVIADAGKPMEAYETLRKALPKNTVIDYTVNCSSTSGNEMLAVLITRDRGMVYFASPAASYSTASLGAEGIGKEIDLMFYRGYINGHVAFCMRLIKNYPQILKWFNRRYTSESRTGIYSISASINDLSKNTKDAGLPNIVVSGPEMTEVIDIAKRIAGYNTTVLIQGESGTGKEVIADVIKQLSDRNDKPYIKINCAAIAENLFESEFFGYEGGAFTGALKNGKAGHFENADGGTLFLDEVGELSLQNQVKLLRVLQQKEVVRVGASKARKVDVRLIAATNRDLMGMVSKGQFREDLYYRLNVINIHIPALRERSGDIKALTDNFINNFNELYHMHKHFSDAAAECMKKYNWPGNVRELENVVQRLMLITENDEIEVRNLPKEIQEAGACSDHAADLYRGSDEIRMHGASDIQSGAVHGNRFYERTGSKTRNTSESKNESTHKYGIDSQYTGENESNAYKSMHHESYNEAETLTGSGYAELVGDKNMLAADNVSCAERKISASEAEEYITGLRRSGADEEKLYIEAVKLCRTTRDIAELLGTSQPTVVRRLKKYGLKTSK